MDASTSTLGECDGGESQGESKPGQQQYQQPKESAQPASDRTAHGGTITKRIDTITDGIKV